MHRRFFWPVRAAGPPLLPVFLPFAGCPTRCVFCAQTAQTGTEEHDDIRSLVGAKALLRRLPRLPAELGFFGGTFTALPERRFAVCLALTRRWREEGLVETARCSTRPDAVTPRRLERLAAAGFQMVELGIQSFSTDALRAARRGYDGETAQKACATVRAAGLRLGVQLLPGMPGVTPDIFLDDVRQALAYGADILRFYPCLVLEGTLLAALWRQGAFRPWTMADTLSALSEGWLLARESGVPVIRMGLAPEPGLAERCLAGPVHPALGSMVQGEALWRLVSRWLAGRTLRRLAVPRACQGFFWGHAGLLRRRWARAGALPSTVCFHRGGDVVARWGG